MCDKSVDQIDIAMPTMDSEEVIKPTLHAVAEASKKAELNIGSLLIVDGNSDDRTVSFAKQAAKEYGWQTNIITGSWSLPAARQKCIENVNSEWFIFLDDDVRIGKSYLQTLSSWISCERVGAIQGRKVERTEHPADWIRRRSRRGGTHATLIRKEAVSGVQIPQGIEVLEDEFLRQVIETRGYRWILEPNAWFRHESQERHPIGWTEGYVGGKFGLSEGHTVALNVPFALVNGRNPVPHVERFFGWVAGRLSREGSVEREWRPGSEQERLE